MLDFQHLSWAFPHGTCEDNLLYSRLDVLHRIMDGNSIFQRISEYINCFWINVGHPREKIRPSSVSLGSFIAEVGEFDRKHLKADLPLHAATISRI